MGIAPHLSRSAKPANAPRINGNGRHVNNGTQKINGHVNGGKPKQAPRSSISFDNQKPRIILDPGELADAVDKALCILASQEVEIFQRGNKLVRPAVGKGIDSKERPTQFPVLIEVDQAFMRMTLSRHIDWFK